MTTISVTDYFRDVAADRAVVVPAREYESYFRAEPRPAEQTRVATTTTRSSVRRPPQRTTGVKLLRDRRARGVVDLRGRAWEDVQRHVDETLRRWEIVEMGGHLFCDRNDPRRILRASGPGGGYATPDAIQLTLKDAVELTRNQPHLKRKGVWHSHPGGAPWPSEPDLQISRRRAEENGTALDVIITGGAIGIRTPVATAWLTHYRDGAWIAEPLHALTD